MKFNPLTKELFTNENELIKQLDCPYKLNWNEMKCDNSFSRKCSVCEKSVVDTKLLTDNQAKEMAQENANVCFYINIDQDNIEITSNGKKIKL